MNSILQRLIRHLKLNKCNDGKNEAGLFLPLKYQSDPNVCLRDSKHNKSKEQTSATAEGNSTIYPN